MQMASLQFLHSVSLSSRASCWLEGVSPVGESWIHIDVDGDDLCYERVSLAGTGATVTQSPPDDVIPPVIPTDHPLNWGIHWPATGDRQAERVDNRVHPLTMHAKMMLVERLRLRVMPPSIIGLGESRVLSMATTPDLTVICQRYQLLIASAGASNYEAITHYILRVYDPGEDPYDVAIWLESPLLATCQPLDCVFAVGHLFVLDVGIACERPNQLHVWKQRV